MKIEELELDGQKILIHSDEHIGCQKTLQELGLTPDYRFLDKLVDVIKIEKPDIVICCGDYWEMLYDSTIAIQTELTNLTDIFLSGNHDPFQTQGTYEHDGILFLHGHSWGKSPEKLWDVASRQRGFSVFGHTHQPRVERNFIDIGSVTLTGTYALCINGKCELRHLRNGQSDKE